MTEPEEPEAARRARAEAQARLMGEHAREAAQERRRSRWLRRITEFVLELLR